MPTATALPVACFAPPLTDTKLARYRELAAALPKTDPVGDALRSLLACVGLWWELPESDRPAAKWSITHKGKPATFAVTPLSADLVEQLWAVTPWMHELNVLSTSAGDGLFDAIPPGDLRDAAFTLLWYAKEISLDREPVTLDRLGG